MQQTCKDSAEGDSKYKQSTALIHLPKVKKIKKSKKTQETRTSRKQNNENRKAQGTEKTKPVTDLSSN